MLVIESEKLRQSLEPLFQGLKWSYSRILHKRGFGMRGPTSFGIKAETFLVSK
jgi:hypothetical protein